MWTEIKENLHLPMGSGVLALIIVGTGDLEIRRHYSTWLSWDSS